MSDIVIKAENLGKKYMIGHQLERGNYLALRDVLMQKARGLWDKTKDLAHGKSIILGDTLEEVWALKDVSFEIRRGEVIGIIGRNAAGKSTLLKVLSRITEPSTGRVTIKGRVASLLEVGTGFHPELTGRENIYLNGAILGMTRQEIKRKFDEIVAFAETEKFLDTPVKRYSSGMYVRLAFAVAAHLEPEILLVDEVLAVGDAAFQKKCLGKMGDVAKEGRTVLFVSHNMAAILNLCGRVILVAQGNLSESGTPQEVVTRYLGQGAALAAEVSIPTSIGGFGPDFRFVVVRTLEPSGGLSSQVPLTTGLDIEIEYEMAQPIRGLNVAIHLWNSQGVCVLSSTDVDQDLTIDRVRVAGHYIARCHLSAEYLRPGRYQLGLSSSIPGVRVLADAPELLAFDVVDTGSVESKIMQGRQGVISPILKWTTRHASSDQLPSETKSLVCDEYRLPTTKRGTE